MLVREHETGQEASILIVSNLHCPASLFDIFPTINLGVSLRLGPKEKFLGGFLEDVHIAHAVESRTKENLLADVKHS